MHPLCWAPISAIQLQDPYVLPDHLSSPPLFELPLGFSITVSGSQAFANGITHKWRSGDQHTCLSVLQSLCSFHLCPATASQEWTGDTSVVETGLLVLLCTYSLRSYRKTQTNFLANPTLSPKQGKEFAAEWWTTINCKEGVHSTHKNWQVRMSTAIVFQVEKPRWSTTGDSIVVV